MLLQFASDFQVSSFLPEDQQEYLVIHTTELANIFVAEYITAEQKMGIRASILKMDELDFETFEPREDPAATIEERERIQRIRILDRSIGDSLKRYYDYRCQVTGEKCGEEYNTMVVEAHHLIPFTRSLNNDTSNLIVVSPTYHRIIHKAKPLFDRNQLAFIYENGRIDKLRLNSHL